MATARHSRYAATVLLLVIGCLAFVAPVGQAQETPQTDEPAELVPVDAAADIFPPVLKVVSPVEGATVTTGRPSIEVAFEDVGSGIDEATLRLSVDNVDVTSMAVVWPELAGSIAGSFRASGKVRYRPAVPLARGNHEVHFSVRDRAGNLAEVGWTFEVEPFFEGLEVGGRNTLKIEWYPISKATDALDLTVQARLASSDLRLRLQGRGTNYPGGNPLFSHGEYNAYLDRYSLEFRRGSSTVAAGHASIPISSEIFQVSREVRGVVASTSVRLPAGQHDISAFYGKLASSSGLQLSVYDVVGFSERWKAKSGLTLGATCVSMDKGGSDGRLMLGATCQTQVAGRSSLGLEMVYGMTRDGTEAGAGFAAHFDVPFASSSLGMDVALIQPGYPLPGAPASLSPQRGGVARYGLRTMAKVSAKGVLNVNAALTRDNLDGSAPYTVNRLNLAATYYYPLAVGWNVRSSYQGELKQSDDRPNRTIDSVSATASLGVSGQLRAWGSKLAIQGTYSAGSTEDRVLGKTSRVAWLSASCSAPIGSWSAVGRLDMSRKESLDDGQRTDSATARVTASGQIVPNRLQGTLTLFTTASDSFSGPSSAPIQRKTETGFEGTVKLAVGKRSTASVVFRESWWTQEDASLKNGHNRTLNLEWVVAF
ncbi:MAG: hypothetical protein NUW12_04420 [Firmicutes bacterium]|jgi:hypothetical protein|nr:hypothetical protein [Bacillota bacterium]MDH7495192.1 hypothetical protein [Bacillota bacterium]